jgi:hypothetical protein
MKKKDIVSEMWWQGSDFHVKMKNGKEVTYVGAWIKSATIQTKTEESGLQRTEVQMFMKPRTVRVKK